MKVNLNFFINSILLALFNPRLKHYDAKLSVPGIKVFWFAFNAACID